MWCSPLPLELDQLPLPPTFLRQNIKSANQTSNELINESYRIAIDIKS